MKWRGISVISRLASSGSKPLPGGHYWARVIRDFGHEVRLLPAQYVRPFVKTNKTDAADAEAICEAMMRPTMRFVPIKEAKQQEVLVIHRVRELLIRQRTQRINAIRGHLAEFGESSALTARTTSVC